MTSTVLLIPQVPESVRRTVQLAKRLFIFAYFEYGFFTISKHYACLALESAIRNRWNATLPRTVTLEHRSKKKPETIQEDAPRYRHIMELCRKRGWRPSNVWIDGRKLPFTMAMLLDDLQQQGIITKWQRGRLLNGLGTRNSLSHPESVSIHPPSAHTLVFVAELVNQLFDSLPLPPTSHLSPPQF